MTAVVSVFFVFSSIYLSQYNRKCSRFSDSLLNTGHSVLSLRRRILSLRGKLLVLAWKRVIEVGLLSYIWSTSPIFFFYCLMHKSLWLNPGILYILDCSLSLIYEWFMCVPNQLSHLVVSARNCVFHWFAYLFACSRLLYIRSWFTMMISHPMSIASVLIWRVWKMEPTHAVLQYKSFNKFASSSKNRQV